VIRGSCYNTPMSPEKPEPRDEDYDLTPEEEEELRRNYEASLEDERNGELIPWEALFPPPRMTG
jgi:hypothetical protein